MNVTNLIKLIHERAEAHDAFEVYKYQFGENMNFDNFLLMQIASDNYKSYQRKIYSMDVLLELNALLNESPDKIVTLYRDENEKLTLRRSKYNLPYLQLRKNKVLTSDSVTNN